jgi:hypothetical protein
MFPCIHCPVSCVTQKLSQVYCYEYEDTISPCGHVFTDPLCLDTCDTTWHLPRFYNIDKLSIVLNSHNHVTFIVLFHVQHGIYIGPMNSSCVKIIFFLFHYPENDAVHVQNCEVPYTPFQCACIDGTRPEDSTVIEWVSNVSFKRGKLTLNLIFLHDIQNDRHLLEIMTIKL